MKKQARYIAAAAAALMAGTVPALAATTMEQTLQTVKSTINGWAQYVVDVVIAILGIIFIANALWAYIQSRRDGQGGGNEKIMSAILYGLVTVGAIFLANAVFFRS